MSEKVFCDKMLAHVGYESTKDMVKKCEQALVDRYGSVDFLDHFIYELNKVHDVYDIIDNELNRVPRDIQERIKINLLEALFGYLYKLKGYCENIDSDFDDIE